MGSFRLFDTLGHTLLTGAQHQPGGRTGAHGHSSELQATWRECGPRKEPPGTVAMPAASIAAAAKQAPHSSPILRLLS